MVQAQVPVLLCSTCGEPTSIHDSAPSGRNVFKRKCNPCKAISKAFERRTKDLPAKRREFQRLKAEEKQEWFKKQKRHREACGERGHYDFQELNEQHSFTDAAGVEERIRTRFIPFDVFAEKVLLKNPGWSEARVEQDWYEQLDNARVRKRMINGEECIAVFEGLVVDEVRSHTTEAKFSKQKGLCRTWLC